jgi:hypothetical protein
MNKRILAALAVLALVTLACGLPTIDLGGGTDSGVLFQDDFSGTGSGWDRYQDSEMFTDYENGAYRIQVFVPNYWSWANPGENFSGDIRVEVDAVMNSGPENNGFGIICHYQDVDNFAILMISSDGYAGIGERINGGEIELTSGETMVQSAAINLGAVNNNIRADCVGSTLTLYANGTQLVSASTSLSGGDVGLFATSAFGEGNVDILFDNFVVTRP